MNHGRYLRLSHASANHYVQYRMLPQRLASFEFPPQILFSGVPSHDASFPVATPTYGAAAASSHSADIRSALLLTRSIEGNDEGPGTSKLASTHQPVPPIGLCTPAYHAELRVDLEQPHIIIEVNKSCIVRVLTRRLPSALSRLYIHMHRGSVLRCLCLSVATIFLRTRSWQLAHPNAITGCETDLRCQLP
jgi:hypothetical protein